MEIKDLYTYSYNYLVKQTNNLISEEELSKYTNETDAPSRNYTLDDAYEIMCVILQDAQMMPKVIQWNNRKDQFKELLYDFNPKEVISKYNSWEDLYNKFKENYTINNADSNRNCWRKWTKGIYSGAKYLSQFKDGNELRSIFDTFAHNDITKGSLPLQLKEEIDSMGFALACNWLKELNYTTYPKPDVHIIDIFLALNLIQDRNEYKCFKKFIEVAKENNVTPYALDKVLWLICSGNYYRHNQSISSKKLKEKFISSILFDFC